MIRKHYSLLVAENVIGILSGMVENYKWEKRMWIECFDDCREQGLVLILPDVIKKEGSSRSIHIAICQCRNSDSIRIWTYDRTDGVSNLMSEEHIIEDKGFSYDEYYEAAEYVYELCKKYFNNKGDNNA